MLKAGRETVLPGAKLREQVPAEMDIEAKRGGSWADTALERGWEGI